MACDLHILALRGLIMFKGSTISKLIFERTEEAQKGFMGHKDPTVLSCGGIYLPRRKSANKVVYHVLNLANLKEPIKIYTGRRRFINQLAQVLAKEALN